MLIDKRQIIQDFNEWADKKYCLEAVKDNGANLPFVKKQTEKICLEAVKNNGFALPFVIKQTYKICKEAVKQNINAICYIRDKKILLKILDEVEK